MITQQDIAAAEWEAAQGAENRAEYEDLFSRLLEAHGLPPIRPTKETEIIGDILSAIAELEAGYPGQAVKTLKKALKTLKH